MADKDEFMPDVGLTSATQPLPQDAKVVIKYSVQVEGLPVYQGNLRRGQVGCGAQGRSLEIQGTVVEARRMRRGGA